MRVPHPSAWLVFLLAAAAAAAPSDFMVDLPPPWSVALELPRTVPAASREGAPEASGLEASARQLRDAALAAYADQQYAQTVQLLDRMETSAPLSPTLRALRAWCASFAGQYERGADLWAQLAAGATNNASYAYLSGWHRCRLGLYRDGLGDLTRALAITPQDRDTLHLAGIAAWGAGRRGLAQRHLVQAMRTPVPLAETFLAMAALQVTDHDLATGSGWLRKGLAQLPADHRAPWLAHEEFEELWTHGGDAWAALRAEFQLPADRDTLLAEIATADPARPRPVLVPPRAMEYGAPTLLRLSEFPTNITERLDAIRLYQFALMMKRLQVETPAQPDWVQTPEPPAPDAPPPTP